MCVCVCVGVGVGVQLFASVLLNFIQQLKPNIRVAVMTLYVARGKGKAASSLSKYTYS